MTLMASPFSARPFSASTRYARSTTVVVVTALSGWAAWTYSKTAKLNAWAWHGLGTDITARIYGWAALGNNLYLRRASVEPMYVMTPDVFFAASDTNVESNQVFADTQWLDFGKPGRLKALTGLDFDGVNVTSVAIYGSVNGDRVGALMESVAVGSAQAGWTYSGGIIPVNVAGTEFKLRFIGDGNLEVQINRLTFHWDDLGMA